MSSRRPPRWVLIGVTIALVGLTIVLWPERGLTPRPLPFPPGDNPAHMPFAVFGYPLLGAGIFVALLSAIFDRQPRK